jgi:hypothetical protein
MRKKALSNKEILEDLIDKIKEIKRITQGKISLLAGYESENYLSEAKSTNNVTDNIVKSVRLLYEKAKVNPDILNEDKNEVINKNAYAGEEIGKLIIQDLKFQAMYNIMMPAFVDISAKVQGKEFSQVYKGLVRAIDEEFENLKRELKEQELS